MHLKNHKQISSLYNKYVYIIIGSNIFIIFITFCTFLK